MKPLSTREITEAFPLDEDGQPVRQPQWLLNFANSIQNALSDKNNGKWKAIKYAPRDHIAILCLLQNSDVPHACRFVNNRWQSVWDGSWLSEFEQPIEWMDIPATANPQLYHTVCSFPDEDRNKPAEHQGIFRKFIVNRVDGSDAPGGKHHGCEYFALDMNHDPFAPAALREYAKACKETHAQLSAELTERFGVVTEKNRGEVVARTHDNWQKIEFVGAVPPDGPIYTTPQPDLSDAYAGAIEEVNIWKKRALKAEELNRKFAAVVDTCDSGHMFAKLTDHPKHNGRPRCPHCMAIGLANARERAAELEQQVERLRGALMQGHRGLLQFYADLPEENQSNFLDKVVDIAYGLEIAALAVPAPVPTNSGREPESALAAQKDKQQ